MIRIYSDIRSYQNHTLLECDEYLNIRIFVSFSIRIFSRIIFVSFLFIRIYSDIHLYRFLDTNIFGYSFVSKSIRMSHSGLIIQGGASLSTLTFSNHKGGGQSWTLTFFFKLVTYRPTLSKIRGGPVKKNTLYIGHKCMLYNRHATPYFCIPDNNSPEYILFKQFYHFRFHKTRGLEK